MDRSVRILRWDRLSRRSIFLSLLLGGATVLGVMGGIIAAVGRPEPPGATRFLVHQPASQGGEALTLSEAWDTALAAAADWEPGWAITLLQSIDVDDQPGADTGRDGQRRSWHADFRNEKGELRFVQIVGAKAVRVLDAGTLADAGGGKTHVRSPKSLPRPAVDSPAAAQTALAAQPALTGSPTLDSKTASKAVGFHFVYAFDDVRLASRISVLASVGGEPASVEIDPGTGAVIRTQRRVWQGGGMLVSSDDGATWAEASIDGLPLEAAEGPDGILYAVSLMEGSLALSRSGDAGRTWTRIAPLPAESGGWMDAMAVIQSPAGHRVLITTDGGAWWYDPESGSFAAEPGPGDNLFGLLVDAAGAVHAQGSSEPGIVHHYALINGNWSLIARNVGQLARWEGEVVGFRPGRHEGPGPRVVPDRANEVASVGGVALAVDLRGLLVSRDGGATWDTAVAGDFVSVAVREREGSPPVLLAETFRPAKVFRSLDGGETWVEVLNLRSESWGVFPFGPSGILVLTAGKLTWVD